MDLSHLPEQPPKRGPQSADKPDAAAESFRPNETGAETAVSIVRPERGLATVGGEPLKLFLQSCGGSPALELRVAKHDQPGVQKVRRFKQPFILIGRSDECDLRLRDPEVSRRHAYLQLVDGAWQCVDLGSQNGVYWPSGRQTAGQLKPEATIRIGPYDLIPAIAESSGVGPAGVSLPDAYGEEPPEVYLEFLNGACRKGNQAVVPVRRRMTLVGTNRACKLKLHDKSVADVHASLVLTRNGLWIVGLAGGDRTLVNGEPVRWRLLQAGSELKIGKFRLRVHYGSPAGSEHRVRSRPQPSRPQTAAPLSMPGGLSEEFVLALMSQLAGMQQQYLEHSREQMLLTGQLLASIQGSAQEATQRELARVEEITRELQTLRGQLMSGPPLMSSLPAAPHIPIPAQDPVDALKTDEPRHAAAKVEERPAVPSSAAPPALASDSPSQSASAASSSVASADSSMEDEAETRRRRTRADVQSHAWLMERMAILEEERSSRWRKIVGALTGGR